MISVNDLTVEVVSPAGDLGLLFVSLPADPLPTPFGVAFVDLTTYLPIGPFVQLPGEHTTFNIPIPLGSPWNGLPLAFQVGHLYQATGVAELSNGTVVSLY